MSGGVAVKVATRRGVSPSLHDHREEGGGNTAWRPKGRLDGPGAAGPSFNGQLQPKAGDVLREGSLPDGRDANGRLGERFTRIASRAWPVPGARAQLGFLRRADP